MSSTTPSTIDLSGNVTREQYTDAVTGLVNHMNQLSANTGWCSSRHAYFQAVLPEYDSGYDGLHSHPRANLDLVPDDADYALLLRNVRARALWYVRAGIIDLSYVNDGFAAANLPAYVPSPDKAGQRVRVTLPAIEVTVTDAEYQAGMYQFADNFARLMLARLDRHATDDIETGYVPNSASFPASGRTYVRYEITSRTDNGVDAADTLDPHYR